MSEEEQIFSKRATPPFDDETVQLAMLKMKLAALRDSVVIILAANAILAPAAYGEGTKILLYAIPAEVCVLGTLLSVSRKIYLRGFHARKPGLWFRFRFWTVALLKRPLWDTRRRRKRFHSHRKRA